MSSPTYEFKKFVNSIFTQSLNEGKTQFNPLKFEDNALTTLSTYIVNNNLIGTLGSTINLSSANAYTASFLKNLSQVFYEKSGVGLSGLQKTNYDIVTLQWNKPIQRTLGFAQADFDRGLPDTSAEKLHQVVAQWARENERRAWKEVEKFLDNNHPGVETTAVDLVGETNEKTIYQKIVTLATKMTRLNDDKDGIDGVNRDDIVIHVKPEILDKVAQFGIVGDAAQTHYIGGQYAVKTLGGYKIYANEYLDKYDVIVATTFSAASATRTIALNYDRLVPTNDMGLYFEAQNIFGIIHPSTFKALKSSKPFNFKDSGLIKEAPTPGV